MLKKIGLFFACLILLSAPVFVVAETGQTSNADSMEKSNVNGFQGGNMMGQGMMNMGMMQGMMGQGMMGMMGTMQSMMGMMQGVMGQGMMNIQSPEQLNKILDKTYKQRKELAILNFELFEASRKENPDKKTIRKLLSETYILQQQIQEAFFDL
ncbi:hypothetical protein KKA14_09430 [bacterium]|nr:hypothetical protein [bacterium]